MKDVLYHCLIKDRSGKINPNAMVKDSSKKEVEVYNPYLQYRARLKIIVNPTCSRGTLKVESSIFPEKFKELN